MKNTDMNITPGQDKFLRLHIDDLSQPIRRSAYRPPSHPLPSEAASKLIVMLSVLAGVMTVLAAVGHFSK